MIITKDFDAIGALAEIERLVINLLKTDDVVFLTESTKTSPKTNLDIGTLARDFLNAIIIHDTLIAEAFPYHNFNPLVHLFIKHLDDEDDTFKKMKVFSVTIFNKIKIMNMLRAEGLYEKSNKFIYNIRQEAKNSLIKAINNRHRSVNKNSISIKRYIDYLFNKHARLLVIRIDLYLY
ncbi:hypothetical protein CXB77_18630 [Chromatium okenii]|uniref:Uncharacterized protein n=2 Tax=Chromatium okenii TaxID=61644 RepID=A0A2S7XM26_9GAMM|nr:hypothetical protein CXB77_18630 [Chromatium okenii]